MPSRHLHTETRVLIIGGGATGTGIARDLALRGVHNILVEKSDINAGASGANHGLLHSGARYAAFDPEAAMECRTEGDHLKRLAPNCIENTGGLFVALNGDDETYVADFPGTCAACGIIAKPIDIADARQMEPALSEKMIAAYQVPDASIDPFRLSMDNLSHARQLGTLFLKDTAVSGFERRNGKVVSTLIRCLKTGEQRRVSADYIVNATGAWADKIAALASITMEMIYSKGTLLVSQRRMAKHIINRLRKASDGDIIVPGGTVSILGTTSVRVPSPDNICPTVSEVDHVIDTASEMIPSLLTSRYIRAYAGVRPLFGNGQSHGDRSVSRGFVLLDHGKEGVENFITITGGKLTTYRLMAEKTTDLICHKMGITTPCKTLSVPLPDTKDGQWTQPGKAPRHWMHGNPSEDSLLCECDMVPKSIITEIARSLDQEGRIPDLAAIALRSRMGKGPCQGTYCSLRALAHLYDMGLVTGAQGIDQLQEFLSERWLGQHMLLWDAAMVQSEFMEAVHCGVNCLEQQTGKMTSEK
ncbi:MAG: anaerobic glycerol-3-phosphate dehydrogenase subunit A [Desulfobacteraceae bacterium]|nr:anaerobic glycerol-3-phosphate dehydrogenase subunit A [Desulfobacteraceae bacterium]